MRLKDVEPIIRELQDEEQYGADYFLPIELLKAAPTIEAKPVVYCKDCEYFNPHCQSCFLHWQEDDDPNVFCFQTNPDDYCSFAEKKEPISQTHENGVKIPVLSMEDVPKIMEE